MSGIQVTATVRCDGKDCGHTETVTTAKMANVRHILQRRGWNCHERGSKDYCPDCATIIALRKGKSA